MILFLVSDVAILKAQSRKVNEKEIKIRSQVNVARVQVSAPGRKTGNVRTFHFTFYLKNAPISSINNVIRPEFHKDTYQGLVGKSRL